MRKTIAFLAAVAMMFALFAGCASQTGGKAQTSDAPGESPAASPEASDETAPGTDVSAPAGLPDNPSDSYKLYNSTKKSAYDRLNNKLKTIDELYKSVGMPLFTLSVVDLSLVPLMAISSGEGGKMALEAIGLTDIKATRSGNDYSLTYNDPQNGVVSIACKYDPAADSLHSTISDSTGKETMFFEYVRIDSGYASQYYMDNGDGTFTELTSFINDTDIAAFGIYSAEIRPASIFGNTSLTEEFVKNGELYFMLKGDSLTVFKDGEVKAY